MGTMTVARETLARTMGCVILTFALVMVSLPAHAVERGDDTPWRVTEIYLATLGYAPDVEGVDYWVENIRSDPSWTPTTVAQSFFDQPLVQEAYPESLGYGPLIESLYENLFDRPADAEGRAYWIEALETGRVQRNEMIIALIDGGWGNPDAEQDMARFGNRVRVALEFVDYQRQQGLAYDSLEAGQQRQVRAAGREVVSGVTHEAASYHAAVARIPELLRWEVATPQPRGVTRPELVSTSVVGSDSASLSWLPARAPGLASDEITYTVHLSDEADFIPSADTAYETVTGQHYALLGDLEADRRYYARVAARGEGETQSWSNALGFRTGIQATVVNPDQPARSVTPRQTVAVEPDTLLLTSEADVPGVGEILSGSAGEGFFRRVTAVEQDGERWRVTTESASLSELFEELHLSSETQLSTLPAEYADPTPRREGDVESRSYVWPETGLQMTQHLHSASGIQVDPQRRSGGSVEVGEIRAVTNNKLSLEAPINVVVEPGETARFDALARVIEDSAQDYTIRRLEYKGMTAPRGRPTPKDNIVNESWSADGSRRQGYLEVSWTPGNEHVDDAIRPYVATFEAEVQKDGCRVFCDRHSVEVEVPVYVSWGGLGLPEDDEAGFSMEDSGIRLNGDVSVSFDPTLKVDKTISWGRIQYAEVVAQGPVRFDLDTRIRAQGSETIRGTQRLLSKRFIKAFAAGPVPVVMTGRFELDVQFTATTDAALDITKHIGLGYDLAAGLIYADGEWERIGEAEPVYRYDLSGEADTQAFLEARLIPSLTISFYETATGQMRIEPYLFADMGVQGQFAFLAEGGGQQADLTDWDADYRFTQLDFGGGVDANLRADLSIFDYVVAGYPSTDRNEFLTLTLLDRTAVFGLPDIRLSQTSGRTDELPGAMRVAAEVTNRYDLNPFVTASADWAWFPRTDAIQVKLDRSSNGHAIWACADDERAYTLRFSGHSRLGYYIRQFEDMEVFLPACEGQLDDGTQPTPPSPEFESDASQGQVTMRWDQRSGWTYNVFVSRDADCDVRNYTSCTEGRMMADVVSGVTIGDLDRDVDYYVVLEFVDDQGYASRLDVQQVRLEAADPSTGASWALWISEDDDANNVAIAPWNEGRLGPVSVLTDLRGDRRASGSIEYVPAIDKIAFRLLEGPSRDDGRIYLMDRDGDNKERLSDIPVGAFAFSPDGTQVIFAKGDRDQGRNINEVFIKDIDSKEVTRVFGRSEPRGTNTHKTAFIWAAEDEILFSDTRVWSDFQGQHNNWVYRDGVATPLPSNTSSGESVVSMSPDGTKVLLYMRAASSRGRGASYIQWPDGESQIDIFPRSMTYRVPTGWASDSQIFYRVDDDIWSADLSGGNKLNLTEEYGIRGYGFHLIRITD
ncbi:DUF4214 domain-containing protein [Ectothiorhodospira variabilis]|uniref:DUF4214 domain-containing protein n=1 Tax=Ectothiorhodospira variabilis TaxID=505694 RepID=UPI001EFAF803|nr:DUF4214 domain-containing protein [Ectothiorhodospira variabilis]MCG5495845.1 DUF4214 domain-containing protein [Ectothiorhodospira variabilis]MCG5504546.1 DUF4214 domain-containing protein [Ectothiorhodospira variabilis]MCG5507747.1 DUF4214 domain-containing protein [Ectothiorhodospira variabilis]